MSRYEERLASFTAWPHASPSPEDLAEAGFSYHPTNALPDNVICKLCKTQLCDWELADDPMQEHYRRSKSCIRFAKGDSPVTFVQDTMVSPPKDSQASLLQGSSLKAPKPSTKDIGFLDPSLQHDFPDLCLFHDAHVFCDRIEQCRSESGFLGADILELLPKCLRGQALTWFRSQSECQDLALCIEALKARFPQQASSQEAPQASSQAAPHVISQSACQAPDYHHCKLCNASFSSMARLIRHTQENICNKPSCRHCELVFSSKNQLHRHLREECRKQTHRSSPSPSSSKSSSRCSSRSSSSPSPPCSPTWSSTWSSPSSTACSSTCSPKSSPAPSPTPSPPPRYQVISPSPPTYGNYLTVADLYARYAPRYLKMDDLFRMFGRRSAQSSAVPTSSGVPNAPTTAAASKHPPIRHRGRCQAKKGDGSTQAPKHLKQLTKPKQQQNPKQKIGFIRTSLQSVPCKSVLPLQRSRSMSCPIAAPGSPSFLASSDLKLAAYNSQPCNASDPRCLPLPCIGYQCPTSSMSAL